MRKLKILHTADLHMDSAFQGLSAGKAVVRRSEQRQLLSRLASLVREEQVDLVLLCGDLLDSDSSYFETGEQLITSLGSMSVPVFIAPGNHDFYSLRSPYARLKMPSNVYLFRKNEMETVELPQLSIRVHGAAFVGKDSPALLEGFSVSRQEGVYDILCLHGEVDRPGSPYNPISLPQLEESGVHYAALGHIHAASGLLRAGNTWYSWPGCPEGRGFDECGEKNVNIVELDGDNCTLRQLPVASRRYEILEVNVTGTEPLLAVHSQLPDETVRDIYRIILTGEAERAPDMSFLYHNLSEFFFALQIRDHTHLRRNLWERAGEDSLRGIFLEKLKEKYDSTDDEAQRRLVEQAARWGLAALERGEEVVVHEDQ